MYRVSYQCIDDTYRIIDTIHKTTVYSFMHRTVSGILHEFTIFAILNFTHCHLCPAVTHHRRLPQVTEDGRGHGTVQTQQGLLHIHHAAHLRRRADWLVDPEVLRHRLDPVYYRCYLSHNRSGQFLDFLSFSLQFCHFC